jgi:16S rRNA (adenine1518-N6/adenine1519-N6)-dimethyltransferase
MKVQKKLKELGIQPVDGQNFLTSEHVIEALVSAGEVEDKNVLEIGGGTGAVTEKLIEKAASVTVVENDTTLSRHLKEEFGDSVEVINKDYLQTDIEAERCVSNLPFQITSEAIEKLGKAQLQSALIVQKQLAEKAVADSGDSNYGSFSVLVNYYFVPVKLRDISSANYYPSPDVETSILKLYPNSERHGVEDEEAFFESSRALFTHKRKKVRNAFVDARHIFEIEKDYAKEVRDDLPHSEKRVVNLDVRKIAEITEYLVDKGIITG